MTVRMLRPLIYLAGPYTKPDPAVNTRNAILMGQALRDQFNVAVIVPHVTHFEHMLSPRPYSYWLRIDIDMLRRCDAVFRMEGESSGADAEVEEARRQNIPVFEAVPDLKAFVLGWDSPADSAYCQPGIKR